MSSPFPGMDPYLEGHLWPDVHNSLAYLIKVQLAPRLGPEYMVHLNNYTVEDTSPEEDIGILYPDVEVLRHTPPQLEEPPGPSYATPLTPASLTLPAIKPVEVRIPVVEIRDRKGNRLVTAIEILSPVNKRKPGLQPYREKRLRLHQAGVNLLEIDLLRRGERPLAHPYLPKSPYLVSLLRAGSGQTDVWAIALQDALPVVPVPLGQPEEETFLDLGQALREVYEQGYYSKSINYGELPPPPAFPRADLAWMKSLGCLGADFA
jgi:hypothetical protein